MGRQSLVRASRVVAAGTLMASIRGGLGGCLRSASSGGVGAPRLFAGPAERGPDPQHNDLQGRIRLAWRPVDLRLLQHALWPRHRRPSHQQPFGQGGLE